MDRMLALLAAVFFSLDAVGAACFFLGAVVAVAADAALEPNIFAHGRFNPKAAARKETDGGTEKSRCQDFGAVRLPKFLSSTYSMTLVTTPEPTVLPPSRMAKRRPSSMAMGISASSSTLTLM